MHEVYVGRYMKQYLLPSGAYPAAWDLGMMVVKMERFGCLAYSQIELAPA